MGNRTSSTLVREPEPPPLNGEWRSAKAKQLDMQCGPGRDPVSLGKSFSYMELNGKGPRFDQGRNGFSLFTERRAMEKDELDRMEALGRPFVAAAVNSKASRLRGGVSKSEVAVPKWRVRMHAARRRMTLQVSALVLLNARPKGPNRRLDNLGFCIPLVLRENTKAFMRVQNEYIELVAEVDAYREALELPASAVCSLAQLSNMKSHPPLNERSSMPPQSPLQERSSAPLMHGRRLLDIPSPKGNVAGAPRSGNGLTSMASVGTPSMVSVFEHGASNGSAGGSGHKLIAEGANNGRRSCSTHALPSKNDSVLEAYGLQSRHSNTTLGNAVGGRKSRQGSDPGVMLEPLANKPGLLNRMANLMTRTNGLSSSPSRTSQVGKQQLQPMPPNLPPSVNSSPRTSTQLQRSPVPPSSTKPSRPADFVRVTASSGMRRRTGPSNMSLPGDVSPFSLDDRVSPHKAVLCKVADMPAIARKNELLRLLNASLTRMHQSDALLQQYINRCNIEWATKRLWRAAPVDLEPAKPSWLDNEIQDLYSGQVLLKLQKGAYAVQLHAGDDAVKLPSGELQDLWTADPWLMAGLCSQNILPSSTSEQGMHSHSLGSRVLQCMVDSLERLAGPEAVTNLSIILHISDQQVYQVQSEVWEFPELYSRIKDRLLIVVHPRQPGFSYSEASGCFMQDLSSPSESLGSGFSMLQLSWPGEAATVSPDALFGDCHLKALQGSVMEELGTRGVEWLLSWRARDLGLLSKDSVFDVPMLAYMMKQHKAIKAMCAVEVCTTSRVELIERHDSVILGKVPRPAAGSKPGPAQDSGIQPAELRSSELCGDEMKAKLKAALLEGHNIVAVGMHRYIFHMPTLGAMLQSPVTFRPKLNTSREGLLRVSYDISDLTANCRAQTIALQTRSAKGLSVIIDSSDMEELLPALMDQEQDALVAASTSKPSVATENPSIQLHRPIETHAMARRRSLRHHTYVTLLNTENPKLCEAVITSLGALVRLQFDSVVLMTLAVGEASVSALRNTLEAMAVPLIELKAKVAIHVPVRCPVSRLVECIEREVLKSGATIVVMGTKTLVSNPDGYLDSLSLNCVRRLQLPVILISGISLPSKRTSNARLTIGTGPLPPTHPGASPRQPMVLLKPSVSSCGKATGIRCLAILEQHSRPLVQFVCGMMDPIKKSDRLMLGQFTPAPGAPPPSPALTISMRTLLNNCMEVATQHDIVGAVSCNLEGDLEKAVLHTVHSDNVQLVALQMPRGNLKTILPKPVLQLLRICPVPVLIFPHSARTLRPQ